MDGDGDRLFGAHDVDLLLAAGNPCVEEVPVEHLEMGGVDRDHDAGAFRPLELVDRGSIGQNELFQFRKWWLQL